MLRLITTLLGATFSLLSIAAAILLYRDGEKYIVRTMRVAPVVAAVGFAAISVFEWISEEGEIGWFILYAFFFLMGLILFIRFCFWNIRIDYERRVLCVCRFWGKRELPLDELSGITGRTYGGIVYFGERRPVRVDDASVGFAQLEAEVDEYYCQKNHCFCIPEVPEKRFGGHLQAPEDFILVFVMLGVFTVAVCAGILAMFISDICVTGDDCVEVTLVDPEAEPSGGALVIHAADGSQTFRMWEATEIMTPEELSAIVDRLDAAQEVSVFVRAKYYPATEDGEHIYALRAAELHDEVLISFEQTRKAAKIGNKSDVWVIACALLAYVLFIWSFCYVVTNAPRYPRLVRLLVKEEYINW